MIDTAPRQDGAGRFLRQHLVAAPARLPPMSVKALRLFNRMPQSLSNLIRIQVIRL